MLVLTAAAAVVVVVVVVVMFRWLDGVFRVLYNDFNSAAGVK